MKNIIPYGKQHITQDDIDAVSSVLRSDYITQGPVTKSFEKAFARYIGSDNAVAVANGTAALHLSAMALGIKEGDTVITSPLTFAASANCVLYCGGSVKFADINPDTLCIDLNKAEDLIKKNKKHTITGIIPVDFAGYPVNTEDLRSLADQYGLWILEDACHAPGATFKDSDGVAQKCGNGTFSDLSIFSFHPVKHITTGEGGMITGNNADLLEKVKKLRIHGITKDPDKLIGESEGGWYYEMQELGYNYRITDFQCALGISQLKRAGEMLQRRKEIASVYTEAFRGNDILRITEVPDGISHAWHLYIIQGPDRHGLYNYLRKHRIYTQVHYIPVHLLPYYQQLGWRKGDLPVVEDYYKKCLSLPIYPSLSDDDQAYVIEKVNAFYGIK